MFSIPDCKHQLSSDKNLAYLCLFTVYVYRFNIYGVRLPSCTGIILSHYKDSYEPTSILECHKGFVCFRLNSLVELWILCEESSPEKRRFFVHFQMKYSTRTKRFTKRLPYKNYVAGTLKNLWFNGKHLPPKFELVRPKCSLNNPPEVSPGLVTLGLWHRRCEISMNT